MAWACCAIAGSGYASGRVILNETIIRPDDRIIAANQQSPFFVQLDIDSGAKAEVSVIPISRPIFD